MAQLNFPDNPINGQLYPNPCPPGTTQYRWDQSVGIWRIVGVATEIVPGTYGDEVTVGQFTVDVTGRLTDANNVRIREANQFQSGIVKLTSSLTSDSDYEALSGNAGRILQNQIGNLDACTVPQHTNIVEALNYLQAGQDQLFTDALVWCGYYNAEEGFISFVSLTGLQHGYRLGERLPVPSKANGGDMFIVNKPGNPYVAGDYNAPDVQIENGNWIVSETVRWSEAVSKGTITASEVQSLPQAPLTSTNVQSALYQITQLFRTGIGGATISPTKPANPYPGMLWWDDDDGIFYIFYTDINSSQWVELGGGGSQGLNAGRGTVYEIRTGVGLLGGPITTEGTIYLQPAFYNAQTESSSTIGGVIPRKGFDYSNTTGWLDLSITSDFNGKDPNTAFSQEGANILNSKITAVAGVNILAGTYNARFGRLVYATPAGLNKGFVVGENLPPPSSSIDNYYVIVTIPGDQGPDGTGTYAGAGDWYICQADSTPAVWFLIDYENASQQAVNISVVPIPGIEFAGNVQTALEAVELQAQDRIEFCEATTDGLQIKVSQPQLTDNDGTTLSLGLDYASIADRGIVQLTNDFTGNSQSLAITQQAANQLNAKIESLVGANVLAGTYNSNTGVVVSVTAAGANAGFVAGFQAPQAASVPDNYYVIVIVGGGFGPPGAVLPASGVQSGDWFIVQNDTGTAEWITIDYESRDVAAENVSLSPVAGLSATNVQQGIEQIQAEFDSVYTDVSSTNDGIVIVTTDALTSNGLGKKASFTLSTATATDIGGVFVAPNNGIGLTQAGGIYLTPATATVIGGVKVGAGLRIDQDGVLSVPSGGEIKLKMLTDISPQFDGVQTAFVLTYDGGNLGFAGDTVSLFIDIGGVTQAPETAYSYDGLISMITFTSPPPRGASFSGRVLIGVLT